jgi:ankyrin repeat protein
MREGAAMNGTNWLISVFAGLWLAAFAHLATTQSPSLRGEPLDPSGLAAAVRADDLAGVRDLLRRGADVNAVGADGGSALHWAVYTESHSITDLLLSRDADVEAANREGVTPLALAATNGDAESIRRLLDAGAEVDARGPNDETALMLAARTGATDAIALLIDRGAAIDATESLRGTTALMWAAANRNTDAIRLLLARGADAGVTSATSGPPRNPYLAPSARSRITAYEIGYGDPSKLDREVTEVERLRARASFLDQDASDALADLLAEQAAAGGVEDAEVAFEELSNRRRGAASEGARGGGLTALVFAAREGDMASVRALIEGGADVNQTTAYGWTPLLAAVQNRYYRLASYLLEQGADPNIANEGGWSPLYIATDNRNIEGGDYPTRRPDMDHLALIRLLLDHGADPNLRMKSSTETRTVFTNQWLREEGATAFLRAAQSGDLALMRLLLEHGADPSIATDAAVTPLMAASGIGWVEGVTYEWSPEQTYEAVELLLELGADINAHDTVDGRTALMGAAHKGRNDVVALLVDHGADLAAHDIGSRDSVHQLYGATWRAVDYADGLVRVGVQSAIPQPETGRLIRQLMVERGMDAPPEGRTLESVCIVDVCQPPS